jgi:hypothetical protein
MVEVTDSRINPLTGQQIVEPVPGTAPQAAQNLPEAAKGTVRVKAVASFHGVEGHTSAGSELDVPRDRAAALHANGLVDYLSEEDEAAAHEEAAKAHVAARRAARVDRTGGAVREEDKTSPLKRTPLKVHTEGQ